MRTQHVQQAKHRATQIHTHNDSNPTATTTTTTTTTANHNTNNNHDKACDTGQAEGRGGRRGRPRRPRGSELCASINTI